MADFAYRIDNPIVWLIVAMAAVAFSLLAELIVAESTADWYARCEHWLPGLRAMLNSLPLLGLLGTIVGLMNTFRQMARDYGFNPEMLMSSGIADALFTTQMGLVMVVPGWVLLALLGARMHAWTNEQAARNAMFARGQEP